MVTFEYDCPHCGKEVYGSFGDNVYCPTCDKTYETDCELVDAENVSYSGWLTGAEHNGKVDVPNSEIING